MEQPLSWIKTYKEQKQIKKLTKYNLINHINSWQQVSKQRESQCPILKHQIPQTKKSYEFHF